MTRVVLLIAVTVAACGDPGHPAPAPAKPAPAAARPGDPNAGVAATAYDACQAIARADREAIRARFLTHDELVAITSKEVDRAEYDREVDAWIEMWTRDREGHAPITCARVEVKQSRTVPANDKRRRELTYAIVVPVLRIDGQDRPYDAFPLFLVRVDSTWKLSLQ